MVLECCGHLLLSSLCLALQTRHVRPRSVGAGFGSFGSKNLACLDGARLVCQILVDCWLVSMREKLVYLSDRRFLLQSSATCDDDEQFPNIKCVSKWISWQQLTCLPENSSMGFCMRSWSSSSYQGVTMDVVWK